MTVPSPQPRALARDEATERWGDDPQRWPRWTCPRCLQLHSDWSLDCGRCGDARSADYPYEVSS